MSDEFLIYLLSGSSIFSSLVAVYAVVTRKNDYIQIVDHYASEIAKLKKETSKALQNFAYIYKNFFEQINEETKIKMLEMADDISKITRKLNSIEHTATKIEQQLKNANNKLDNEIKKRDAIIERKSKQIQRLKNEI